VIEIPQFQEACWGEKEGIPPNDDLWIHNWQEGSEINNAEKYTDFLVRVSLGLQKALQYEGPVLIVSHGIVYWAVREILGLAIIDLGNCETIFHKPPKYPNNSWSVYPI
jgi:probable phosphoglycerate mutase